MRIFEKLIIFHPSRRIIIPPPFLDHLTCPKHMEDNRKRLTYTQTQYIIAIIWHRIIREASVLTFYPRGSRSPPPLGRIGFLDPRYDRVNGFGSEENHCTVTVILSHTHSSVIRRTLRVTSTYFKRFCKIPTCICKLQLTWPKAQFSSFRNLCAVLRYSCKSKRVVTMAPRWRNTRREM